MSDLGHGGDSYHNLIGWGHHTYVTNRKPQRATIRRQAVQTLSKMATAGVKALAVQSDENLNSDAASLSALSSHSSSMSQCSSCRRSVEKSQCLGAHAGFSKLSEMGRTNFQPSNNPAALLGHCFGGEMPALPVGRRCRTDVDTKHREQAGPARAGLYSSRLNQLPANRPPSPSALTCTTAPSSFLSSFLVCLATRQHDITMFSR